MHEVQLDFKEVHESILSVLIKEDPKEAKRLGLLEDAGANELEIIKVSEEQVEDIEDLVQKRVNRFCEVFEEKQNARMAEFEKGLSQRLDTETAKLTQLLKNGLGIVEKEINLVAI